MIALHDSPTVALVRVPWNDAVFIKRVLDLGAEGVLVPHVSTAEEAQSAVRACKYRPQGNRGTGPRRPSGYGAREREYLIVRQDFGVMSVDAVLFPLSRPLITPGALHLLARCGVTPLDLLHRHVSGDFGDVCAEEDAENRFSLEHGFRIFSSYTVAGNERVWVITEADHSATTLLM